MLLTMQHRKNVHGLFDEPCTVHQINHVDVLICFQYHVSFTSKNVYRELNAVAKYTVTFELSIFS